MGRVFNVLVVDDEAGDVELIKAAFAESRYNCRVIVAGDGAEAMAVLRKEGGCQHAPTPQLVLLDINMPRMNGREVLRAMKADPRLSRIPVVMLTTSEAESDVVAAYALGAAGYVTKPLDMDDLFAAIRGIEAYWFGLVRCPAG